MSDPFLGSEEYGERAHELYNQGQYEEAVEVLREGLSRYPSAAELHIGLGYARLAREEYAWARAAFERALGLHPGQEDALAGLAETLLKFGERTQALRCYDEILALGFREDHDLMIQIGRALFREGMFGHARGFFEICATHHPESSEAAASLGYAAHRLGDEGNALLWLRRALDLDATHSEARIYLGNVLYDRGEYEAALVHFERTEPHEHTDELAIWRIVELKKSIYRLPVGDPELVPWRERLEELEGDLEVVDQLLAEVEAIQPDGTVRDPTQLELFGTLLVELQGMQQRRSTEMHRVRTTRGVTYAGTWEEIVLQMKMDDRHWSEVSLSDYMEQVARKSRAETGMLIPATDAEAFVRGSALAGLLRILR
ncbi:MAG TPA: tetratricopeptide repeat protein [Gemmatimonadales bacterium]|jgi:Tfp pilus assembly protein PilF|nr:tetratricopeptide repeat protein [Gemmatimonadales bacterium]